MPNLNTLKQQRTDLLQKRASCLEAATKFYQDGNMDAYNTEMEKIKGANGFNAQLENLDSLITEQEKSFGEEVFQGTAGAQRQNDAAGVSLVDGIRSTEKYAKAFMEAVKKGLNLKTGVGHEALQPLFDADLASKSLSIGGGETPGEDGGFLVPADFDKTIITLAKEYIDLSTLVNVENVGVNNGWRAVDTTASRRPLTKVDELGEFKENDKPKFKRVNFNCSKYGDVTIVSGELLEDYSAILSYLAAWFAPKFVLTKNMLILEQLGKLPFTALAGDTDAAQLKAMKHLLNVDLNTAHSKNATILTNSYGYDLMDGWTDANGRPVLVPDPKTGDFERFKNRPVRYADPDEIPAIEQGGAAYHPFYVGNLKAFCSLFLRKGFRVDTTNVGGSAWRTYSTEVRMSCRMDAQTVDETAVKLTGIADQEAAAAAQGDEEGADA